MAMGVENQVKTSTEGRLMHRVLWLNAKVFGLAAGLITGFGLFAATNWLVVKGGHPVGPHLKLLGQFFWGYTVTFQGSLIGLAYGFVLGFVCGASVSLVYNKIAGIGVNRPGRSTDEDQAGRKGD